MHCKKSNADCSKCDNYLHYFSKGFETPGLKCKMPEEILKTENTVVIPIVKKQLSLSL